MVIRPSVLADAAWRSRFRAVFDYRGFDVFASSAFAVTKGPAEAGPDGSMIRVLRTGERADSQFAKSGRLLGLPGIGCDRLSHCGAMT